ncbi:MAG: hypothetical protein GKR91_11665 [Pseudomonadales bacterium]|nr:hypothetical protein [Pseudomonadales bacterium]
MNKTSSKSGAISYWVLAVYFLLLALIIPWYWPEGDARLLFGFPMWVLASLSALFLTSCFTAWLCLRDKGPED